jgi:aspartyl aminopeptidase
MDALDKNIINFLNNSPTSYHAVASMSSMLKDAGFIELKENQTWDLVNNGSYYIIKNNASLIAFKYRANFSAFRMVGAHTDSPCLKIKPQPEMREYKYLQLQTEVYGSPLLNTWFDRDLSVAGVVYYQDNKGKLYNQLINFKNPIAIIPSLAIHLDRNANSNRTINPQLHVNPILATCLDKKLTNASIIGILHDYLIQNKINNCKQVLDYDLSFYDTNGAKTIGLHNEFISSARLDNLLSCFLGMQSLINSNKNDTQISLLVCNDHEEVGSQSYTGALGCFLSSTLKRICKTQEKLSTSMDNSMLISADNAHGIHPNYPDKHDKNHAPILNNGVVIKYNCNQSYATNAYTAAIFKNICNDINVNYQTFCSNNTIRCGSTIGPLTSSLVGVKALDIGIPTFAMHSIRELAGMADCESMLQILKKFFDSY